MYFKVIHAFFLVKLLIPHISSYVFPLFDAISSNLFEIDFIIDKNYIDSAEVKEEILTLVYYLYFCQIDPSDHFLKKYM